MTIKQLKNALQKFPEDLDVVIGAGLLGYFHIEQLEREMVCDQRGLRRDMVVVK